MPAILAAVVLIGLSGLLRSGVFAAQAPPDQGSRLTVMSPAPAPSASVGAIEQQVAVDVRRLDAIEPLVREAIAEKKLPGAVVVVGRGDRILYQKAIGQRALVPSTEPMTLDTIFDLASLTKVVATTTSVMMLVEQGRIRLSDRVSSYIPGFERYGKGEITIRHLLTHVSGLRPDVDLADTWMGYETAIALAVDEVPTSRPGERFVYSDINFFLLGDIVRRVSGLPLDRFAHERIFDPLGMRDTTFNPPASLVHAYCADRELHAVRLAVPGTGYDDAAWRRARSHGAPDGRRRGSCRPLQHCRRSGCLLPHVARRWRLSGSPHPLSARSREDDQCRLARSRREYTGARLGYRLHVLVQPRRVAADWFVRPYRLHGDVDLDRSGHRHVRDLPLESRASGRQGRRDTASRACRDRCRCRSHEPAAGGALRGLDRPRLWRVGPGSGATIDGRTRWDRRPARGRICTAARKARGPPHQSHGRRARRRYDHRRAERREGRQARRALQSRARHPRRPRRQGRLIERREDRPADLTRSMARPGGPLRRCSRGSTCSSSISRTSARGSTPT